MGNLFWPIHFRCPTEGKESCFRHERSTPEAYRPSLFTQLSSETGPYDAIRKLVNCKKRVSDAMGLADIVH
jgi:hypothetical protein